VSCWTCHRDGVLLVDAVLTACQCRPSARAWCALEPEDDSVVPPLVLRARQPGLDV